MVRYGHIYILLGHWHPVTLDPTYGNDPLFRNTMLWSTVLVLLVSQLTIAKPLAKRWDDFSVKHEWAVIPNGWQLHGPAPAEHKMDLRIGLKQDKMGELITALYEVSDPSHER